MKRKIVTIDEEKCNGCGLCVNACHEGALRLIDGKAKLISESYCDGLGDCLPKCPTGAITIREMEAAPYNEEAVKKNMIAKNAKNTQDASENKLPCECPGSSVKMLNKEDNQKIRYAAVKEQSRLAQWPCQLKLVPANAPFLTDAHLLIAADCTAYAYASIHNDFMRNRVTLIGCPKLDNIDYTDKLTDILKFNNIKSITVLKMQVPCCNGIANAAREALIASGKMIPWNVATISTEGDIIED
ncbi:4Fe-4S binding protein [Tepidanaerobacter sp. EBM-38]|uniref:4Fe-4S binding protein n=1 Tax=Tepidanaerobacter sp. EBM-38 TaxID=1918496 RepID=UPI000A403D5E|nr:4Fe-4S binding protein [Tepidanaerobacter sp. EBM-38]